MNLFNITEELLKVKRLLEIPEDELSEGEAEQISQLQNYFNEKFVEKVDNISALLRTWEADISACKEEKKRIDAIKKSKESAVKRLKNWMMFCLMQLDDKMVESSTTKISIRKGRDKLVVNDDIIESLPDRFIRVKKEADKTAIMEEYKKTGVLPQGCSITKEDGLNIK